MSDTKLHVGKLIVGNGKVREGVQVGIKGDQIEEVGTAIDGNYDDEIDLSDEVVLPGLIDSHVHLNFTGNPEELDLREYSDGYLGVRAASLARDALRAGFTTLADVAARDDTVIALRNAVDDGVITAPRIKACGNMIAITGGRATYGHGKRDKHQGVIREVDGPAEARQGAREQLMYYGADLIKVAATGALSSPHTGGRDPQLTVAEMRAAVEEAHHCGRPVHAHAYGEQGISNALEAGVDVIVHGQSLTDEHISQMEKNDQMLVPTLAVFTEGDPVSDEQRDRPESSRGIFDETEGNFKNALESEITIAAGTDTGMPGVHYGDNAEEFIQMVRWGMDEIDAITAGTLNAAKSLNAADELGTVEAEKHADLLVLDSDPTDDIAILGEKDAIEDIVLDGAILGPSAI